jgi:hypothetical protein
MAYESGDHEEVVLRTRCSERSSALSGEVWFRKVISRSENKDQDPADTVTWFDCEVDLVSRL